jgi:GT2 family glycosyltransferase
MMASLKPPFVSMTTRSASHSLDEMTTNLVSVIVPTHQDGDLLRLALPALREQRENIEVIVVNNDPLQDIPSIAGAIYPEVKIVEMGYGAGFGRAINTGIELSAGQFILVLNADVFLAPSYISEMIAFFSSNPRVGCAGGKLYRYDLLSEVQTDKLDTAGVRLGRNRRPMARGEGELDHGQYDVAEQVFGVDSAGLFARRSALESIKVGDDYFDSSFFLHKEDTDLCWRLRLAGWEIWYVPTAVGAHARTSRGLGERSYLSAPRAFHESASQKSSLVKSHAMKNQWLMLLKNEDFSNFVLDVPFIVLRELTVVFHNLIFAPRSLIAIREFARLLRATRAKRETIKGRQVISPAAMRHWLGRA